MSSDARLRLSSTDTEGPREGVEDQVNAILSTQPIDLDELHNFSRLSGGFKNHDIRRQVWPKFLGINRYQKLDFRSHATKPSTQLRCDLDRSFHNFEHTKDWSEEHFAAKKVLLGDTITAILARNPALEYYQGYHTLCIVVLEVCEDDPALAFNILEYLSNHFFKDYMGADFDKVRLILPLVLEIIRKVDSKLFVFLTTANIESFFSLSWIITWFGHDVSDINIAARIYDSLICSHPLFILYVSAAVVLHAREDIFALPCEFSEVHKFLISATEREDIPFDRIIRSADRLMSTLPPVRLKAFADETLSGYIRKKQVQLFVRPPCIVRYTDTDAVMLERYMEEQERAMKITGGSQPPQEQLVSVDLLAAVSTAIFGWGGWGK